MRRPRTCDAHTFPGGRGRPVLSHYGEMPLAARDGAETAARKRSLNAKDEVAREFVSRFAQGPFLRRSRARTARILGPTRRSEGLACETFARWRIAAPAAGGSIGVGGAPQGDALPSPARERRRKRPQPRCASRRSIAPRFLEGRDPRITSRNARERMRVAV
jgi:hypothetical protein